MSEKLQNDINLINLKSIKLKTDELRNEIIKTPVIQLHSSYLNKKINNTNFFLKLECFQHTGTFKARGALSVSKNISIENREMGITAASAGNHAIASAWAAKKLGLSAKVIMRSTANPYRLSQTKAEGAEIIIVENVEDIFKEAEMLVKEEGRTFIHPFEGISTTLGTAGVGLEFIESIPYLDAVIVSIGGGGLISGIAAAIKLVNPDCKVYGVEPKGADSMSESFRNGEPVKSANTDTIVDSLAPPMALPFSYSVCKKFVDEIVTVSDDEICSSMVTLQEEAKLAVEPAAAATLSAAVGPLINKINNKNVGLVMCGSNIDSNSYSNLLIKGKNYRDSY